MFHISCHLLRFFCQWTSSAPLHHPNLNHPLPQLVQDLLFRHRAFSFPEPGDDPAPLEFISLELPLSRPAFDEVGEVRTIALPGKF